jgi:hypothetical protein
MLDPWLGDSSTRRRRLWFFNRRFYDFDSDLVPRPPWRAAHEGEQEKRCSAVRWARMEAGRVRAAKDEALGLGGALPSGDGGPPVQHCGIRKGRKNCRSTRLSVSAAVRFQSSTRGGSSTTQRPGPFHPQRPLDLGASSARGSLRGTARPRRFTLSRRKPFLMTADISS